MAPGRPDLTTLAAAALAAGSLSGPCSHPSPLEIPLAALLALLARPRRSRAARLLLGAAALALAAHAVQDACEARTRALLREIRPRLALSDRCDLEGIVSDAWPLPGGGSRMRVDLVSLRCGPEPAPARGGALLTVSPAAGRPLLPRPGDHLRAHARLSELRPAGNPGGFESAALLRARGILLAGSVKSAALASIEPRPARHARHRLGRARLALQERLGRALHAFPGACPDSFPLLSALLLGQRAGIDPAFERALQASGLYHLVAISGLHVALLGWLVLRAGRALAPDAAAAALSATLITGYVLLVGAPASALRALGLLLVWEAARWTGRRSRGLAAVAVAAALLLVLSPGLRADPGFWLSACATAGILGLRRLEAGEGRGTPSGTPGRIAGALWRSLEVSAAAYLAVAPLQALWFQRWTPIGIVLNLAAVPLSSLLLVCALALAALDGSAAAAPVAAAADLGVRALAGLASPALFDSEIFRVPPPGAVVLSAHLVAAAAVAAGAGPSRAWRTLLAAAHAALLLPAAPAPAGTLEIALWDVGQGESILVRLPDGSALLVDAGGRLRDGDTAAGRWAAPALRASGVRRLRALAITHLDSDHAAGAEAILRAPGATEVWVPRGLPAEGMERLAEAAGRHGARLRVLARGDRPAGERTPVETLAPPAKDAATCGDNEGSLVLRAGSGAACVLLTGDLDAAGERDLARLGIGRCAVLKVSHHGSRGSSDGEFLRTVRPRAALVSAGARNAWGHPHRETLERLRRCGARALSTSEGGAVRARLADRVLALERWRDARWQSLAVLPLD